MSVTLGQRVEEYRVEREMSLTQLAERAGIGKATLHAIENRPETRVSADVLYAIAWALGTTMETLMDKPLLASPQDSEHALHLLIGKLNTENRINRRKLKRIEHILQMNYADESEEL